MQIVRTTHVKHVFSVFLGMFTFCIFCNIERGMMPVRFVMHTSNLIPHTSVIPEQPELYVFDLLISEWVLQTWIVPRPASPKTVMHRM